jgi:hypothetical protein
VSIILVERAYKEVFGDENTKYNFELKYSRRFSDFNANVKRKGNKISFSLCDRWKDIDIDIQIGLISELFAKLFGKKVMTTKIELYNIFKKNMHICARRIESEPSLIESFIRVNEKYFYGMIDMPNLVFGNPSRTVLGSYNFQNDTITISSIFYNEDVDVIDLVMHHELLHKKLKFDSGKQNYRYHTTEFRKLEKEFENCKEIEKKINNIITRKKKVKTNYKIIKPKNIKKEKKPKKLINSILDYF